MVSGGSWGSHARVREGRFGSLGVGRLFLKGCEDPDGGGTSTSVLLGCESLIGCTHVCRDSSVNWGSPGDSALLDYLPENPRSHC